MLALCTPILLGCFSSKSATDKYPPSGGQIDTMISPADQTLLLLIDLTPVSASLRKARLVNGQAKKIGDSITQSETIILRFTDNEGRLLATKEVNNPLIKYREYVGDDGSLSYIRTSEDEASILVRTQYIPSMNKISVSFHEAERQKEISVMVIPTL